MPEPTENKTESGGTAPNKASLRKVTFRHLGSQSQASAQADDAPVESPLPDKPLQLEEVRVAWQKYVNSLPDSQTAMAQRMRAMQPVLDSDNSMSVTVGNAQVRDALENMRADMEQYMRKELSNGHMTISFQVMEMKQQATYSKSDHMQTLMRRSHLVDQLVSTLDLELS